MTVRLIACLGYLFLWLSGLILFLVGRHCRFVCFHSLQSLLFFSISSIWYIIYAWILAAMVWDGIKIGATVISVGVTAIVLVAWVCGMVQTLRGKYHRLPLIGNLSLEAAVVLDRHEWPAE